MEGGAVGHNFERDHPCQVSFSDDFFGSMFVCMEGSFLSFFISDLLDFIYRKKGEGRIMCFSAVVYFTAWIA